VRPTRTSPLLCLALALIALAAGSRLAAGYAADFEANAFAVPDTLTDDPPVRASSANDPLSQSETNRFREALPGERSYTSMLTWAPRYFNATSIDGFDDSFSKRWLPSMQLVALRYEGILDFRLNHDLTLSIRPQLGFGYGYSTLGSHEQFRLSTANRLASVSTKFTINQLMLDIGATVGLRIRAWEGFFDWRSVYAFRFQRLTASETAVRDAGTGLVDTVRAKVRKETARAFLNGGGFGIAAHFGAEPWNYRFAVTYRPMTVLDYDHRSGTLQGIGLELKADGLRLSDDAALALGFRFDFWLPNNDFNDVLFFEFNIGVRFS
jgi:hypothetical protein